MNKKELKKFESLQKWINQRLAQYVIDPETTVTWDGEDPGFINVGYDLSDDDWFIELHTSSGDIYCIADSIDCEDMTVTEIKEDLMDRIEVMKVINWSEKK